MSTESKKNRVKIMVFGTFDGLHLGHVHFFKQARSLVPHPYLIVSIARDKNVKKIKGKLPEVSEKGRMALIKKCEWVDEVILGGESDHIAHILKISPQIIALGYDQSAYVENLEKDLKKNGLKVKTIRLKPHKEHIYKNSLLRKRP